MASLVTVYIKRENIVYIHHINNLAKQGMTLPVNKGRVLVPSQFGMFTVRHNCHNREALYYMLL